ncbi:MAG: RagB/SusD family nutrient uptake outer membrane protein [Tannerellaceae bacterium]|nr:RagB/SusD family nutrient uptake outer membrane protein [Tannerellaceae bacterium]
MKNILKLLALVPLFVACDDLFSPAIENIRDLDAMYEEPTYAQGILANAYILLPYSASPNSDVATDDAVTNETSNNYLRMATGSWTSNSDPMSQWQGRRNAIQYLNIFLANADMVNWADNEAVRIMYNDRLKGEAYALRALHLYHLLQAHAGWTSDGRLLGVPIVTEPEDATTNFNYPRNTFQECIDQIFDDVEKAIELLPLDYKNISDSDIPAKYRDLGVTNASSYNRANGEHIAGRISGRIAEAIRVQAALLAASPAYSSGTTVSWEDVANYAAIVLDRIDGVGGLDPDGGIWYTKDQIESLGSGLNKAEILWRGNIGQNNELESDNFPPTLYGKGRVNPTQNLVNAFPMANGYPITDTQNSGYKATDPYADRDPRLANYIVVNGSVQGPSNTTIITGSYGTDNNAINRENELSTRTGYYLRKLLRSDANPDPQFNNTQKHFTKYIRYTEIFLAYAEAANEAWGPTGSGSNSYSAYDVIKAIRQRALVGVDNGDPYLESVKTDKDKMRELIRNERRLELCFENIRFWDLRRWQEDLNETARGVEITQNGSTLSYSFFDVEVREYKDYMYHGPIPYSELLKYSELEQNKGW